MRRCIWRLAYHAAGTFRFRASVMNTTLACVGYANSVISSGAAFVPKVSPDPTHVLLSEGVSLRLNINALSTRAPTNLPTVFAVDCIATPPNMSNEPMNNVARRPSLSEQKGVNGRP